MANVKIVKTKEPIITDQPRYSAVFKSNPIALSQIKCLTPPRRWYQTAHKEDIKTSLPNQLFIIALATWKYRREVAAAKSHNTISKTLKIIAFPVMRIKIEVIDVN